MDKLLDEAARELQAKIDGHEMNGYYSALGFLSNFARKVNDHNIVSQEN